LALALARAGRVEEAIPHFQAATNLEPQNAQVCFNLGLAYSAINDVDDALKTFAQVIKLRPNDAQARARMALILASTTIPGIRNGPQALRLAEEANELTGDSQPDILEALDSAYAEVGRFDDAIKTAQKAQELAAAHNQKTVADQAAQRIALYRAGKPIRQ
jgi:tetratricopeptide (TPR) repeat protein